MRASWAAALLDNPILVRELQGTLRQRRYVLILSLALTALGLGLTAALWGLSGPGADMTEVGRRTFLLLSAMMLALVLLVFPSFAATAVVEERTQRSLDLLLTSRLSAAELALGKLLGALVAGIAFLAATAPLAALTSLFGGVDPGQVALSYLVLLVAAVGVTSYALLVSTLTVTSAQAVTRTYMVLPGLTALTAGPIALAALPGILGETMLPREVLPAGLAQLTPTETTFQGLAGATAWTLAWAGLFWIVTVGRLLPPGADRARLPRLWCAGAVAAGLGLLLLGWHDRQGSGVEVARLAALTVCLDLAGGVMMLLALAVDDPDHRPGGRPPRGLRGLLAPGAGRGARFVLCLHLVTVLVVGALALRWLHLPTAGGLRAPGQVVGWGALYSTGFLLALAAACVLASRRAAEPARGRSWILLGLAVVTLGPAAWWALEPPESRGDAWKGYALSPVTAMVSLLQPARLREDRRLIVFGPSAPEIAAELERHQLRVLEETAGLPVEEAARLRSERLEQRDRALRAQGIEAHQAGAIVWWTVSGALLVGLALGRRKAGFQAGGAPAFAPELTAAGTPPPVEGSPAAG